MDWYAVTLTAILGGFFLTGEAKCARLRRERAATFAPIDALPPPPRVDAGALRRAAALRALGPALRALFPAAAVCVYFWPDLLPGGFGRDWWQVHWFRYVFGAASVWGAFALWQATRDRWPVAAFGPPRLWTPPVNLLGLPDERHVSYANAESPTLVVARPPPAQDGYDVAGTALYRGALFAAAAGFLILVSDGEPEIWLMVAAGALWAANAGVRHWWNLPVPYAIWLSEVGLVRFHRRIAWADADRVAVAPVPEGPGEGLTVEVASDGHAERFRIAPEAVAAWEELSAAIPPDRLVLIERDAVPAERDRLSRTSAPVRSAAR